MLPAFDGGARRRERELGGEARLDAVVRAQLLQLLPPVLGSARGAEARRTRATATRERFPASFQSLTQAPTNVTLIGRDDPRDPEIYITSENSRNLVAELALCAERSATCCGEDCQNH